MEKRKCSRFLRMMMWNFKEGYIFKSIAHTRPEIQPEELFLHNFYASHILHSTNAATSATPEYESTSSPRAENK
jgi:hypothetical protein